MIDQVKKNVEFYIRDMENIITLISEEPEILDHLSINKNTSEMDRFSIESRVKERLKTSQIFILRYPE